MKSIDVLAVGAHPDDVELGCSGTLSLLQKKGYTTAILDLTMGEKGSRGDVNTRYREAYRSARILGVTQRYILHFGDAGFENEKEEFPRLIQVLRYLKPKMVLAPFMQDRNPDHEKAHHIIKKACFYAGSPQLYEGPPYRVPVVAYYFCHDITYPSFVVEITETWEQKKAAIQAFHSQFLDEQAQKVLIGHRDFLAWVEARARHFGFLIHRPLGEPFWFPYPLPIKDPFKLFQDWIP